MTCQDYVSSNINIRNLTITEQISTPELSFTYGNNFFTNDQLNITSVKKGFVPVIVQVNYNSNPWPSYYLAQSSSQLAYRDYSCSFQMIGNTNYLTNIVEISQSISGVSQSNIVVMFLLNEPLVLINYTISHTYLMFGTFNPYIYTNFFGNSIGLRQSNGIISELPNPITINQIETNPIQCNKIYFR